MLFMSRASLLLRTKAERSASFGIPACNPGRFQSATSFPSFELPLRTTRCQQTSSSSPAKLFFACKCRRFLLANRDTWSETCCDCVLHREVVKETRRDNRPWIPSRPRPAMLKTIISAFHVPVYTLEDTMLDLAHRASPCPPRSTTVRYLKVAIDRGISDA